MSTNLTFKSFIEIPLVRTVPIPGETDATTMVQKYQTHPKKILNAEGEQINGLLIDKADLVELANDDNSANYMIVFAVSYDDVNKPKDEQNLTALLIGIDENGAIVEEKIMNKFKPCPSECGNLDYKATFQLP